MTDKRSFPRLSRDWDIEYQMSDSESVQPILVKSGIRDFSGGGFSFRSESACPLKVLFKFSIKGKGGFMPVVGVARIAWARGHEGLYENGAQFVWVKLKDMDAQTAIAQYVLDHMFNGPS